MRSMLCVPWSCCALPGDASLHKQRGFHLLEILVTLCLVSILSVIGLSHYSHYVLRAARLEAGVSLSQLAVDFEKGYFANQGYGQVNMILPTNKHYRIVTTYVNKNDYQLMAQPVSKEAKKDACGALALNAAGEKWVTGTAAVERCW